MSREQQIIDRLVAARDAAGLFFDFDGTLSEIAPTPEEAAPIEGAAHVLERLARSFRSVAVVSGRPGDQVRGMIGADVTYVGLYGRVRGSEPAPTGAFLSIIPDVVAAASGVQGAEVEEKGPHVAVHYRAASDPVAARRTLIRLLSPLAERAGCRILEGKRVVEIHPEDAPSKGQAVERLVREGGLGMVLYAGDDLGDMSAFAALDRLAPEGVEGIKVAVRTTETPDEVVSTGDLVVDGPHALVSLMAKVADAAASAEG